MSPQTTADTPASRGNSGRGGFVAAALLRYLTAHPGGALYRAEIAADTGLTEERVRTGMANLRHSDKLGAREALETVVAGQVWRWHPNKARTEPEVPEQRKPERARRIFEEVGTLKDGAIVQQDEDGNLYRAVELT